MASSQGTTPSVATTVPLVKGPARPTVPTGKRKYISWVALAMMTTGSVASLRSAPTMAVFGLASVFLYVVPGIVFFVPTGDERGARGRYGKAVPRFSQVDLPRDDTGAGDLHSSRAGDLLGGPALAATLAPAAAAIPAQRRRASCSGRRHSGPSLRLCFRTGRLRHSGSG